MLPDDPHRYPHAEPEELHQGATGDWEIIIGMEVHAQVTSESKLFSGASTEFGGRPTPMSLVDAAMPGMLPVINEECVRQAVRTGLGLKAQINNRSVFDRKNYFLSGPAAGLPDQQFKQPDRRRGQGDRLDRPGRKGHSRSRSASSGCISSRTPASRSTTSIRPCPMSTSTAPAWR
jgi:hypothetical protein